jgi:hypothetical protein
MSVYNLVVFGISHADQGPGPATKLMWCTAQIAICNEHSVSRRTVSQILITVDEALHALAEARSPEQLIGLANTAEALRRYAQRARLGMAAQNRCAELRLRAERKLGQYLAGTPRNSGGRPKPVPLRNGFPTLDDLGITRKLSHRAQRLAEIPTKDFDWYLRTAAQSRFHILGSI